VPAAINFYRLGYWFDSANFPNGVSQCFDVINTWLERFWIWGKSDNIPASRCSHARSMVFTQVIAMRLSKSC
jgi:hypothetical protein